MSAHTQVSGEYYLFLLAGPTGAGKSTLLQSGFELCSELLDDDLRKAFLETNLDSTRVEHGDCMQAFKKKSYFHAVHIPELKNMKINNRHVLLHIDLLNVLKNLALNDVLLSQELVAKLPKQNIKTGCKFNRDDVDCLDGELNDALMSNYLRDDFFYQFKKIIILTLHCDYDRHQQQLLRRDGTYGFGFPASWSKSLHREIYDCWRRNIYILNAYQSLDLIRVGGRYKVIS